MAPAEQSGFCGNMASKSRDTRTKGKSKSQPRQASEDKMTTAETLRELIPDPKHRIRLHDFVAARTAEALAATGTEKMPTSGEWSAGEFEMRLAAYETAMTDLVTISILLGRWGTPEQEQTLFLPARRLSERIGPGSGSSAWLSLRWYPLLLLLYSASITLESIEAYSTLARFLHLPIRDPHRGCETSLLLATYSGIGEISERFKLLPSHEKQYVPRSEYLFQYFRQPIEEHLSLGFEYERRFDRCEILLSLECFHLSGAAAGLSWGPIGRFGWKHRSGPPSPFSILLSEASAAGENWPPLVGGLFGGTAERFREVAAATGERLNRIGWY
jgi:hypothetical protein